MLWIKRILWLFSVLSLVLCYILTLQNVFAIIGLSLLLLPFFSWLLLVLSLSGVKADISVQDSAAKNGPFNIVVRLNGNVLMPAMHIKLLGSITNLLTHETVSISAEHCMPHGSGAEFYLSASSPFCGKLSIDFHRIILTDVLGLFHRKIHLTAHSSLLVLPETFEPQIELVLPDMPDIESDDYSPACSGDDPSELFGIRDYREGDALKSIHWKLSEKYDRTVVREMSQPVSHSLLLLMDNCPFTMPTPDRICNTWQAMLSVSQALADLSVPHRIAWFNHDLAAMESISVSSLDDLIGVLGILLAIQTCVSTVSLAEHILSDTEFIDDYSRTLLFASVESSGITVLPGNITQFLPEATPTNALSCLPEHMSILII